MYAFVKRVVEAIAELLFGKEPTICRLKWRKLDTDKWSYGAWFDIKHESYLKDRASYHNELYTTLVHGVDYQ